MFDVAALREAEGREAPALRGTPTRGTAVDDSSANSAVPGADASRPADGRLPSRRTAVLSGTRARLLAGVPPEAAGVASG